LCVDYIALSRLYSVLKRLYSLLCIGYIPGYLDFSAGWHRIYPRLYSLLFIGYNLHNCLIGYFQVIFGYTFTRKLHWIFSIFLWIYTLYVGKSTTFYLCFTNSIVLLPITFKGFKLQSIRCSLCLRPP